MTAYLSTAFVSRQWKIFNILAPLFFLLGFTFIVIGGTQASQVWMFAPLIGIIFTPLSVLAKTWGWAILFLLMFLFLPIIIFLQGIG